MRRSVISLFLSLVLTTYFAISYIIFSTFLRFTNYDSDIASKEIKKRNNDSGRALVTLVLIILKIEKLWSLAGIARLNRL